MNPVTNKIYVANESDSTVTVIDGATNGTSTVSVGSSPQAVAVNPVTNKIYVANTGTFTISGTTVTVIDGATNNTTTVSVGTRPQALAVNPVTNKIYVANNVSNNVTVIDGTTNATTTITLGTSPLDVAVNPVTNKIYVSTASDPNGLTGSLTVIDGATNSTTIVTAGSASMLAVNPLTDMIFANQGQYVVAMIDGATNTSATLGGALFSSSAVAVNALTNQIYVTGQGSCICPGAVTVFDGATGASTSIGVGTAPGAVAVNPLTNKIYVANAGYPGYPLPSNVTVIDGATSAERTVNVGGVGAMTVNPVSNKIYVTNGNTVTVIDGATNTTTTVAAGTNPSGVAVNPVTNKVYVANNGDGTVTEITEAQAQPNPLTTAIIPLPGNSTTNAAQVFQFTASNSAAPPVTNLYFQFDTFGGPWNTGTPGTEAGSFSGAASGLSVGTHILYAFAADGEEATSIMEASSPVIGGTTAYLFEEQGISTSTTLTADVNSTTEGKTVTFTAAVSSSANGTPSGSVSFFDGNANPYSCTMCAAGFLGNVALDNTAHGTFATSSLPSGPQSVTAAFIPSPSGGFAASTSPALTETINVDFSIGVAAGGSNATVKAGETATYSLQFSLIGAAATDQLMLTVSCTGAPPKAACSGPASPVTVTQAAPATVAINVSTLANGILIPSAPSSRLRTPWNRLPILWVLPMLLLLLWLRRCKQKEVCFRVARPAFAVPALLLAMVVAAASGCGGGGTTTPVNNGTPLGTYTLTVTVAAPSNLTHAQQLTLIVQ